MNKKAKNLYYYSRLNGNKVVMKQLSIDGDYIIQVEKKTKKAPALQYN